MQRRKILVLDAYTNGEQAAFRLISKMGWKRKDCEIIYCGSHANLFDKFRKIEGYAVVPVHNTLLKGPIKENVQSMLEMEQDGLDVTAIGELRLKIRHCLAAPRWITEAKQLERVLSHPAALGQCLKRLEAIGIQRSKVHSTAAAAKKVASIPSDGIHVKVGAITTKEAALAYGLNILEENFQDDLKNTTTFKLLYHKVEIEKLTVGIIGMGRFGKALESFYGGRLCCKVIGSDVGTELTNEEVVRQADVVIFAVPIKDTVRIIKEVMPFTRKDQLVMDITSVKTSAIKAMLKGNAQVVGLHPMFAPTLSFNGQTIVACPARLTEKRWKTWVQNTLLQTQCKIKWSTAKEHDLYMSVVQGIPHFSNIINAILIAEMGVDTAESMTFTSPFYRVMFSLMGRMLSQKAGLYVSILIENPQVPIAMRKRIKIERKALGMIVRKDRDGLKEMIDRAKLHFDKKVLAQSDELFTRSNALMATLYGPNSLILEFRQDDDGEGLLARIARTFTKHHINLGGINYAELGKNKHQFAVSLRQDRDSANVRRALNEMEKWDSPKIKVLHLN